MLQFMGLKESDMTERLNNIKSCTVFAMSLLGL